jgi:hypothetical protein
MAVSVDTKTVKTVSHTIAQSQCSARIEDGITIIKVDGPCGSLELVCADDAALSVLKAWSDCLLQVTNACITNN